MQRSTGPLLGPLLCGCALILARAGHAQDAAPPALDWQLRFQTGQEIRVRRESYSRGTFQMGQQKITMKSSLALLYSLQVLEVKPDATARARLKLLSFGFQGDGGQTFYGPFSSMKSGAEAALRPLRLAAKTSLELSLGPRGELDWAGQNFEEHKGDRRYHARDAQGRLLEPGEQERIQDEMVANGTLASLAESLRLLLACLPREPVAVGQKWRLDVPAHATQPTQTHHLDATMLEAGAASATLGVSEHILDRPQFGGTVQRNVQGKIELDTATGWPLRATADARQTQRIDSDGEHIVTYGKDHVAYAFSLSQPPR